MADRRHYIPQMDAEFDEWLRNFSDKISAIATPLGVTPALITAVTDAYDDWLVTYVAHQNAQDAAISAAQTKDESRALAKEAVRPVVGMLQKNPGLTDADRGALRITIPDTNPTPTDPEYVTHLSPPLIILDTSEHGQITVHFGVNPSNEKRNAKPTNIKGAKIYYRVESGPWTYLADDTNSPYTHFMPITEPQNLEYRAQWFDVKSRPGPFGEPIKGIMAP
ncbi:MAG: hypothetical protein V1701_08120 [Planctomycetota bacterium]